MENRFLSFNEILAKIHDVDVVIIEGFKNEQCENLKKIGLKRANYDLPDENYVAIISDNPNEISNLPVFYINDYRNFAAWINNDIIANKTKKNY